MISSIELNFYSKSSKLIKSFKLSFQDSKKGIEFESYNFTLPDNLFSFNKEKTILSLFLWDDKEEYEYLFYVYKGKNQAYIQLDYLFKTVFELIIYSEKEYEIKSLGKRLNKLDSLGNKYRKRLILINTDNNIVINNKGVSLSQIVFSNYENKYSTTNFYQISAFFYNEKYENKFENQFIVKKIYKKEEKYDFEILKNKNLLNEFLKDTEIEIKKTNFLTSIFNLKRKYNEIFKAELPKLNQDDDYTNHLCEINDLKDLEPFYTIYLANIIFKNQIILNNQELLLSITRRLKEDFYNISLKNNISLDEKIKIMSIYFTLYKDCKEILHINSLKIKIYILSERQENSIMDKVCKFYDNFIELLNEDSKIFFYLLELNSGIGYFHKKKVYTFDLTNIDMVKKHLKSLFPKSLTIYNFYKSQEHNGRAFCTNKTSGIALNEIFLLPENNNNIDIDYNSNNNQNISEEESDEIAMNIVLYLFHEFLGHKKFHSSEEGNDSPKKIVKKNKLITLKNQSDFNINDKNSEFILISSIDKGDSGHFLELCYDKYNNQTIFKLLLSLDNKGKLIYRPDLFTKSNEDLKKYVILKIIAEEKKILFQIDKNMTIEDEINAMCQKIDYQKYIEEEKTIKENKKKNNKNSSDNYIGKSYKGNKKEFFVSLEKNKEKDNKNEIISDNGEEKIEEEENSDDEEQEESDSEEIVDKLKEENEGYKILKRVLEKFNLKNDEELSYNIEKIMNQEGLTEEDQKDLDYLYLQFLEIY